MLRVVIALEFALAVITKVQPLLPLLRHLATADPTKFPDDAKKRLYELLAELHDHSSELFESAAELVPAIGESIADAKIREALGLPTRPAQPAATDVAPGA